MDNKQTKLLLLSTQQLILAYWPQIEPLLASAPVAEELTTEGIKEAALTGRMFIFVAVTVEDVPEVELMMLLAPSPSETYPVINILTVAGKKLRKNIRAYWKHFQSWCFVNGARAIDAYVPERMEKFLEKELGLKKETVHVRLRL